MLLEGTNLVTM